MYKVVVDEEVKEALVFLVINHPNLESKNLDPKFIVCPNYVQANDPCRSPGGLVRQKNVIKHGYLYCCDLKDFYDKNADHLQLKDRLADLLTSGFFVIVCVKCLLYALLWRRKAVTLRLL